MVNIAGMSEHIFLHGGQHCRNVIKKASFQGWSTSPEQVVTMDQNRWSRWIGIYRKRWLGLMFVTQLPQHLPDEVLGLINSFVLHKINDATVVSRLKRSIGGVEESLWNKLPNLAQGQAIVSTPSLTRPLLVAMNPTPCKLLMVD